jgi:hypothetical protein
MVATSSIPRSAERHALRFKLVYDDGESYNAGYVRDVSAGGLFVESSAPLPVGAVVTLESVEPIEDPLIGIQAAVVRVTPLDPYSSDPTLQDGAWGIGFELVDLTEAQRDAVGEMIKRFEERKANAHATYDPFLSVRISSRPVRSSRR